MSNPSEAAIHPPLRGEKILVTGPAGRVAFPIAARLAQDNEVWGIARFGREEERARVEAAGIRARRVDLADPDWRELPSDFTLVLHFAAAIGTELSFADAIRINAVGTGHLMYRFRGARACLVASSRAVYAEPVDPDRLQHEDDPLGGDSPLPYAPTYRVSKLAQEAVAQFWAEELALPTILARLNVVYGDNVGLPAMMLELMKAGKPIPLGLHGATRAAPIHHDDLMLQLPGLLAAASVPATIVNWAGDEPVSMREMCEYMGRLTGLTPEIVETASVSGNRPSDPTRRIRLAGRCRVDWRDGIRRMIEALHPDWLLPGASDPGVGPASPELVPYHRTEIFDEHSIPPGLRSRHSTKSDVWARIEVLEGELLFRTLEPTVAEQRLVPGRPGRVEPRVLHEVEPRGHVRFYVEFSKPR